ncbi:flavodoxin family protein [Vibrio splendidus]|uniref:flavodoxin family protein n=1 Tax=Vibrio splendidus TaxID=29497 RepID=UPI000C84A360|nr:flavodoxin family protein [Vibrio splendidus]PMK15100.1 trp repressor-binding protein [Vibrio splendidus]
MSIDKVGIVFFSKNGATKQVAETIAEGINTQQSNSAVLIEVLSSEIVEGRYDNDDKLSALDSCDAIIFGSPTYMGSPAAQFKSFMDASSDSYCKKAWRNKLAAGFTTGGSLNGEQQQTLLSFFTLACQHGMIWAGLDISKHIDDLGLNRTGSSIGLVASDDQTAENTNNHINSNDLKTAFYFGQRIASLVKKT